jgi:hypothetical protein
MDNFIKPVKEKQEPFQVWSSKYALTSGIYEVTVTQHPDQPAIVRVVGSKDFEILLGNEWHRTQEDAVKRAKVVRDAKIRTLTKQINKLMGLNFEGKTK